MKKATRILALVLCAVMCLGLFVGCGNKGKQNNDTPLVVGYSPFNSKFSPFFSETAYDQDVWVMTAISLLNGDRQGAIIMKGIEGETKAYNGTDYTYYGPADCEIVENTDTDEKRLKFLYAWLTKHQRRMIGYSDDFFAKVSRVLNGYLYSPDNDDAFSNMRELHREVCTRFSYIQQARRVRILEDLAQRKAKVGRMGYRQMMREALELLTDLKFEIVNFFPALVDGIVDSVERILSDAYLRRTYMEPPESRLTKAGLEIRKNYGRLVSLQDGFKAVRRARTAKGSNAS